MNLELKLKDQLQTIKNLIKYRLLIGYFPDDLDIQASYQCIIVERICAFIGFYTYVSNSGMIFSFKTWQILLENYKDYLRALEIVLSDVSEDDVKEFYLIRYDSPVYYGSKSILTEPLEDIEYVKYMEDTSIAYFQEVEDDEKRILEIENHLAHVIEEKIQHNGNDR